jgi:hypothetical protein
MLITQNVPLAPVAVKPGLETYFALVIQPLPLIHGPSVPVIVTVNCGCASKPPAAPRQRHNPTSNFTNKDVFVATFRSPRTGPATGLTR